MYFLLSQDEIDALPEDPRERFVELEALCRKRHLEQIAHEQEWAFIRESRLRYMATVIGAAKHLSISPISDINLPRLKQFDNEAYDDFVNDVQFYVTQLMLENADRKTRLSIVLEGNTRERLRTLCFHLKSQVAKLDIDDIRKDHLVKRIKDFESALDASRLSYAVVGLLVLGVAGAIADLSGAATAIRQLVDSIEEVIGKAKTEQEKEAAGRIIMRETPRQLAPPRPETGSGSTQPLKRSRFDDLDDDIPF